MGERSDIRAHELSRRRKTRRRKTRRRKTRRQHLAAIGLYCSTSAGLEALAPALCREVREMIGGAAAALYWLDEAQRPVGYFHEDAPPMPRELFQNQMAALFEGPGEMSAIWLGRQTGQSIGRLVDPPASYYSSNVYNLLIKACGHHHTLDVRIDVDNMGRAALGLFRFESDPFLPGDLVAIAAIQPLLAQAITNARAGPRWEPDLLLRASLAISADGTTLIAASDRAGRLLADVSLIGQNLCSDPERFSEPPRFIALLVQGGNSGESLAETYPVPGGRLSVRAEWMDRMGDDGQRGFWSVDLQMLRCREIAMVDAVLQRKLSPLQREIALFALLGGERKDCAARFVLSADALKLHVRTILREFGQADWNELSRFGLTGATAPPCRR